MFFMHYYSKDAVAKSHGYEFSYWIYEQGSDIPIVSGMAKNLSELLKIEADYHVDFHSCMDEF